MKFVLRITNCSRLCEKIRIRTLAVSWAWIRKEVVRNTYKPNGKWDRVAEDMMLNFSESGHTAFRASSALERGDLKSKGKGVKSIHCSGDTIGLILGSVADLCEELARDSRGTGKPAANDILESIVVPTEFTTANAISQADAEVQGNLLREFAELPEQQKLTELCFNAGFSKNF